MSTSDRDDMTTVVMACEEFMASTGIAPERLRELLALGWLESRTEGSDQFFRDADIYRVRKLERICCDFELPVVGGTIIVGIALNMLGLPKEKIRVGNMLPAIFLPIGYIPLANLLSGLMG